MRMLAALSLVLLAACAAPPADPPTGDVLLVNATGGALLYMALPRDEAARVDPSPAWDPREHGDRSLAAGEERWIDVEGSVEDGVTLFLYALPAGGADGPVPLTRVLTVEGEELRRNEHRIVIEGA